MNRLSAEAKVSIELLQARVEYDPDTGLLTWKPCDERYFLNRHGWKVWHGKFAGKPIKKRKNRGYVIVSIRIDGCEVELQGHRVAWALMTGAWPEISIDHRDQDPTNNRWSNLRAASDRQQIWNRGMLVTNKSGAIGVHRHSQNGCLVAQIKLPNGKTKHLGCFGDDLEAAAEAYRNAARALHGEFCAV